MASSVESGARCYVIAIPGATRSGFGSPSWVGPWLENGATTSSAGAAVPALVGGADGDHVRVVARLVDLGAFRARLPAAATTTIPAAHRRSTAWSSGSSLNFWEESVPYERLTTRM